MNLLQFKTHHLRSMEETILASNSKKKLKQKAKDKLRKQEGNQISKH